LAKDPVITNLPSITHTYSNNPTVNCGPISFSYSSTQILDFASLNSIAILLPDSTLSVSANDNTKVGWYLVELIAKFNLYPTIIKTSNFNINILPCEVLQINVPGMKIEPMVYIIGLKALKINFAEFLQVPNCGYKL
jgi:hypothetical protein